MAESETLDLAARGAVGVLERGSFKEATESVCKVEC